MTAMTEPPARITVPVLFDFASTLCYVAHRVLQRLDPQTTAMGITFEWQPIDLTAITGWRRGARIRADSRSNIERVCRELDVATRMPPYWPDSRSANAVAVLLAGSTSEATWRERIWSALFEEGRAIDGDGEVDRLARDTGVETVLQRLPAAIDTLESRTREAHAAGVNGVPTFLLDGWPVGGIQEDRTMLSLFERYVRKKRRDSR